ncbi:hypothetical protein Aph01nite_46220 [Acrocarpospora phusangensis]|uniref:DUF4367 domain-containing protein n=1 Tax=Acrocarpospora phusangensis TaxID=1070424 RepID=A0A919UQ05_9ACTN|nr:hypothetical protein [Acrocarpospora phusangensis]GIH26312.1 hypothetical protein Aph01nite_46220 [Acrocarpospora phusangensis]
MRHPTDGTLRRLVDEPAGVADADREHVAGCPVCLAGLASAQEDAAAVGAALSFDSTVDVDAGWRRLAGAAEGRPGTVVPRRRRLALLRSPLVAAVSVVALLIGGSAAAAADWLQIFRTEQIAPVVAPESELVKLPELDAFGQVQVTEEVDIRQVADAGAAAKATGLSVPRVSRLPKGVTGDPTYHVLGRVSGVFTFSAAKAAQTTKAAGQTPVPPPPGLDGSQFQLSAGPGLAAAWTAGRPVPALVVARAVAPTAASSGVPFETARDYLLSLRILPENVASQLRAFSSDGMTLPLFTSVEQLASTAADVGGVPATVLTSRDGAMAAVVWVIDGNITVVAGSLDADEVLSVARELRWDR